MSQIQIQIDSENETQYILATQDRQEAMRCMKSSDAFGALWDVQMLFRNLLNHRDPEDGLCEKTIEHIREKFTDILDDNNVDFECYN